MKQIVTQDGSITLYSEEFNEPYHSKSGAIEEAIKKYVDPCQIANGQSIIDFCFGLGYNSLAAMAMHQNLTIYCLENDATLFLQLQSLVAHSPYGALYQELVEKIIAQLPQTHFTITVQTHTLHFFIEDAAIAIKKIEPASVHAIFFDPFSPKKCPQLWTVPVFSDCYLTLKKGGILATYSYARIVREGLQTVGFQVYDGPIVGRRSPSTLARK